MYRDDFPEQDYHQERQGPGDRIAELEFKLKRAQAENQRLREALTPSAETKAAYWGSDDLPELSWTDIKTLMWLILDRAALQEGKE